MSIKLNPFSISNIAINSKDDIKNIVGRNYIIENILKELILVEKGTAKTIFIYGEKGSGKTKIINFIEFCIENRTDIIQLSTNDIKDVYLDFMIVNVDYNHYQNFYSICEKIKEELDKKIKVQRIWRIASKDSKMEIEASFIEKLKINFSKEFGKEKKESIMDKIIKVDKKYIKRHDKSGIIFIIENIDEALNEYKIGNELKHITEKSIKEGINVALVLTGSEYGLSMLLGQQQLPASYVTIAPLKDLNEEDIKLYYSLHLDNKLLTKFNVIKTALEYSNGNPYYVNRIGHKLFELQDNNMSHENIMYGINDIIEEETFQMTEKNKRFDHNYKSLLSELIIKESMNKEEVIEFFNRNQLDDKDVIDGILNKLNYEGLVIINDRIVKFKNKIIMEAVKKGFDFDE